MGDTNRRGRGWLPVVTAFVAAMLMAPVAGALAAESSPRSQSPCTQANCVFVLDKGRFTPIDVPGAGGTTATDINNRGQIVGEYGEDPGNAPTALHGLLSGGDFMTFDAPGVLFTEPGGINDRGQIVGSTASDRDLMDLHGFLLAEGVEGDFSPIDFPGAPRTVAFDINNRGQIIGVYENPDAAPDGEQSPMRMPMMSALTADEPVAEVPAQGRSGLPAVTWKIYGFPQIHQMIRYSKPLKYHASR
jgi:hypothetical protein